MTRPTRYYIQSGVRRALVSLAAGRKTIPAHVHREGRKPEYHARLKIDQLYTSKRTVECDLRFLRIVPPITDPIEVEPLGARGQSSAIPLAAVRVH